MVITLLLVVIRVGRILGDVGEGGSRMGHEGTQMGIDWWPLRQLAESLRVPTRGSSYSAGSPPAVLTLSSLVNKKNRWVNVDYQILSSHWLRGDYFFFFYDRKKNILSLWGTLYSSSSSTLSFPLGLPVFFFFFYCAKSWLYITSGGESPSRLTWLRPTKCTKNTPLAAPRRAACGTH